MGHPSADKWREHPEILLAGTAGFDHLEALPRLLKAEFPWLEEYEIGFCDIDNNDVPLWRSIGWDFLSTSDFDIENFNEAIAIPYGLSEASGRIRFKKNWVMRMPLDMREARTQAVHDHNERQFQAQVEGKAYVVPEDPEAGALMDSDAVFSKYESHTVNPIESKPDQPEKRKRGRPPKKKE